MKPHDRTDRTVIDPGRPEPEEKRAPPKVELRAGLRIEHYELIRELGRGGMGQVFLARDTRLGRRVAIKFLLGGASKRFVERFLVEARATARCSHENIVAIHAVDEYQGLPYMVLEYVEGPTLATMIEDRPVPVGRAIELVLPVVRALSRAHAENIVHRDLKPENIVVTHAGTVKVLDFGVAKLFDHPPGAAEAGRGGMDGGLAGTLPYMSPEQLGTEPVDHRSDLWAVGIVLFRMIAGKHPLDPISEGKLFSSAAAVDQPMPSLAGAAPGVPDRLVHVVARCLAKKKADRYANADELAAELEPLLPMRAGRSLTGDESPYPGLHAFQEADANRFFGRARDVAAMIARLRDQPLAGIVGPSGIGKSSFVRAGLVPALKSSGEPWEVLIVRPGREPLAALAGTLEGVRDPRDSEPSIDQDPVARLRREPGVLGARLRSYARRRRSQVLLFVDQLEELYTLVADPGERLAFTAALAGAADDPSGPLRVIVSMRSDFLDRAAEDRRFVEELARGLVFLQPLGRAGLEEALVQPLEMLGYGFEPGVVPAMLDALEATPGALPLLQFTAARLWDQRDRNRRVLTQAAYAAMGGVAGALATHADEVLAALAARDQKLARGVLQRLVTPERTRALVEASELRDLAPDIDRIVGRLVEARLLHVHAQGDAERSIELVHESLIQSWPTLRRWLEENHEDEAYLAQLRAAAKQWDARGRPQGLLWRGEAMEEARLWHGRYRGELPAREHEFLTAVFALATRASRIRRAAALGTIAVLVAVIAFGSAALVSIEHAKQAAVAAEKTAKQAEQKARDDQAETRSAYEQLAAKTKALVDAEAAERAAEHQATEALADRQKAEADARHAEETKAAAAHQAADAAQRALRAQQAKERKRKLEGTITTGPLK